MKSGRNGWKLSMKKIERERYCRVCGKKITDPRRYFYCGFNCEVEVRRRRARARKMGYKYTNEDRGHGIGYGALTDAIVNTAIEDIRACSKKDIERYEDPGYRVNRRRQAEKMRNYFDAKSFLLGKRITGLITLSGKGIWKMLMDEKGIGI